MNLLLTVFNWLTTMLSQNPPLVLSAAFIWGILSVILSPCHLSGIPLAIGYINGKGKMKAYRAFVLSLVFAVGILLSLLLLGIITSLLGRMLGDTGKLVLIIMGTLFIVIGLSLFDIIKIPEMPIGKGWIKSGSLWGALALGVLFGSALGPCTFGFMMPVLAVAFQIATSNLSYAVIIILAYALGHCLVIVFAGTFINWVQTLLNWEEKSSGIVWFRRVCGLLIILSGILLIFSK